jgi:hypothetical protein
MDTTIEVLLKAAEYIEQQQQQQGRFANENVTSLSSCLSPSLSSSLSCSSNSSFASSTNSVSDEKNINRINHVTIIDKTNNNNSNNNNNNNTNVKKNNIKIFNDSINDLSRHSLFLSKLKNIDLSNSLSKSNGNDGSIQHGK